MMLNRAEPKTNERSEGKKTHTHSVIYTIFNRSRLQVRIVEFEFRIVAMHLACVQCDVLVVGIM